MTRLDGVLWFVFILTQAASHPGTRPSLRLGPTALEPLGDPKDSSHKHNNPLVVFIDPEHHYSQILNEIEPDRLDRKEYGLPDQEEDAKSLFYSYLRSSPETEGDPEVENHKSLLRQALRARCGKVTSCKRKCPARKPACPKDCEEEYDKEDICDEPKKKKKKVKVTYEYSCEDADECDNKGRTMPPRWKIRL